MSTSWHGKVINETFMHFQCCCLLGKMLPAGSPLQLSFNLFSEILYESKNFVFEHVPKNFEVPKMKVRHDSEAIKEGEARQRHPKAVMSPA